MAEVEIYGNYKGYQGSSRLTTDENTNTHVVDERLTLVTAAVPDIFTNKDVLDIGCNDGRITVGIGPNGEIDYFPASAVEDAGHIPYMRKIDDTQFPFKVVFTCEDFLRWGGIGGESDQCDVIVMLSMIKWIHLEHGDCGLRNAFEKVSRMLPEVGYLVLEPQGWDSYTSAVKKFPELRRNREALHIRPEDFSGILQSVGLELVKDIGGRKRPIWIYKKPLKR
ncbi:Bicoid-interacting protein 3-domain-containing protein [Sphaerosporella brunnea]|uniref:RNA methyltransferase n=1 Tax=Sphaerosporella brunnea TaxID=1250544 RepID=A0A5J5EWM5_9PEZI|nr:Bicoid-interacting protein 3-domain-containing protein [Sphaerosporella brunnea]